MLAHAVLDSRARVAELVQERDVAEPLEPALKRVLLLLHLVVHFPLKLVVDVRRGRLCGHPSLAKRPQWYLIHSVHR